MKLSTTTDVLSREFGRKEAIRIIKNAGFDAYDIDMCHIHNNANDPIIGDNYLEYIYGLRKVAEEVKLPCNQAHAPFPPMAYQDEEYNKRTFMLVKRSIECAGILGAKNIVVHPVHKLPKDVDALELNMEMYSQLIPLAKEYNIKIAIENMWRRDAKRNIITTSVCSEAKELKYYYENLDPKYFSVCLDLGHCGLIGEEAEDAIRILGRNCIHALHVHDNDYMNDTHTLPYLGKMNWENISKALADIGYDGDFTFEADAFLNHMPKEILPQASGFMCVVGRHLIAEIEKNKNQQN